VGRPCSASPDVLGEHPERALLARLEAAEDAHVRQGPLQRPTVDFAFAAVRPLDPNRDRDGGLPWTM
jgi:hypothetical protein